MLSNTMAGEDLKKILFLAFWTVFAIVPLFYTSAVVELLSIIDTCSNCVALFIGLVLSNKRYIYVDVSLL